MSVCDALVLSIFWKVLYSAYTCASTKIYTGTLFSIAFMYSSFVILSYLSKNPCGSVVREFAAFRAITPTDDQDKYVGTCSLAITQLI